MERQRRLCRPEGRTAADQPWHGHLDAGGIVLDIGGQRFASEFGIDDQIYQYRLWDTAAGSERWNYLRASNRGHNLLLLGDRLQQPEGDNPITGPIVRGGFQGAIADLAAAHAGAASAIRRGVAVLDASTVLVQDEASGLAVGLDARWQIFTQASAQLADGGRRAILGRGGVVLHLSLAEAPAAARFTIDDPPAVPAGQAPLTGWRRVSVRVPAPLPDPFRLAVLASTAAGGTAVVVPLQDWAELRRLDIDVVPKPAAPTVVGLDGDARSVLLPALGPAVFDPVRADQDHSLHFLPGGEQ